MTKDSRLPLTRWIQMPNRFTGLIRVMAWLPVSKLPPWDKVCKQLDRCGCSMKRKILTKKQLRSLSAEDVKQALRKRRHPSTQFVDYRGRYFIPIELRIPRVHLKKEFDECFKNSFRIVDMKKLEDWVEVQGYQNLDTPQLIRIYHLFSPHGHHQITDIFNFMDGLSETIIKTLFDAALAHTRRRFSLNLPDPTDAQFRQPIQILHPPRLLESLIRPDFEIKLHKTSLLLLGNAFSYESVSTELEENISQYLVPYTLLKEAMNTRPRGITATPKSKS